jgi:DNA-directed RNA polymerase specialized sigma24 family protein|uniref:hypothetical protein n=1 Tax=Peribacillus sp. FSL P2-0133 TaxID=2921573 RepID=UPI0015CF62D9
MFHLNTVKKAQKGDDQAFINLVHKEKEKLYRTAFLYVKNESDSLDIVQNTIYKAYISIRNLKDSLSMTPLRHVAYFEPYSDQPEYAVRHLRL